MDYNIDKLAEILHTLGCTIPHAQKMEDLVNGRQTDTCYWYLEISLGYTHQIDKNKWRKYAQELCERYSMSSQDFLRFIYQYLEIRRKLTDLQKRYPAKAVEDLGPFLLFDSGVGKVGQLPG